jgi:Mrp family chromosome partitioning ATPase
VPRAEMIIVTSPSEGRTKGCAYASRTSGRSTYLRIVGVIENMSSFVNEEGKVL